MYFFFFTAIFFVLTLDDISLDDALINIYIY